MNRRYNDQDVINDPRLAALAYKYLEEYRGSFAYLVEAANTYSTRGVLSTSAVRGVLNCMSADTAVVNMPTPMVRTFDASKMVFPPSISNPTEEIFTTTTDSVQKVRPNWVNLKTRIKFAYMISKRPNALLVHEVDPDKTFYQLHWGRNGEADWYQPKIAWYCNPHVWMQPRGFLFTSRYIFLNEWEANQVVRLGDRFDPGPGIKPRFWKWCIKCQDESPQK